MRVRFRGFVEGPRGLTTGGALQGGKGRKLVLRANKVMVPAGGTQLTPAQVKAVAAYIWSISHKAR